MLSDSELVEITRIEPWRVSPHPSPLRGYPSRLLCLVFKGFLRFEVVLAPPTGPFLPLTGLLSHSLAHRKGPHSASRPRRAGRWPSRVGVGWKINSTQSQKLKGHDTCPLKVVAPGDANTGCWRGAHRSRSRPGSRRNRISVSLRNKLIHSPRRCSPCSLPCGTKNSGSREYRPDRADRRALPKPRGALTTLSLSQTTTTVLSVCRSGCPSRSQKLFIRSK